MPVELKSPHLQHPGRDALRTQREARTGPRAPRYVIRQAGVCQRGIRPLFASTKKTALSPGQRAPTPGLLGTRPGDRRTRRRTRPSRALETTKDGVGVSLFSAVSAGRALSPTGAGPRPRHFRPREETPQDREDNRKVSAASSTPQTRGLQAASGPVTASEVASSAAAPPA